MAHCHNWVMSEQKTPVYLDGELWRRAQARAAGRGQAAEHLVEEAVRRYLELDEFLEHVWANSPDYLSEEESLTLANREVHAMRRARANDASQ